MDMTLMMTAELMTSQRTTAVQEGHNQERRKEKRREDEFQKKLQKMQEEKDAETVVVKPYPSYDAFARKVTVYPFRSSGHNYEV